MAYSNKSLYMSCVLDESVSLSPSQMGREYKKHLMDNLTMKAERKTNKDGVYVSHVIGIVEPLPRGMIMETGVSGDAVFRLQYNAMVCAPMEGMVIIMKVVNISRGDVRAINGPINGIAYSKQKDESKFMNDDKDIFYSADGRKMVAGDFVKVMLKGVPRIAKQTGIEAVVYLMDQASPEEIETWKSQQPEQLKTLDMDEFI